jgi:hypothetical protein
MAVKFEYTGKLSDGRTWDLNSNKRVTIELEDNDLTVYELLEEFMNFLQAVGYQFELGDHLEIVNDLKNSDDNSFNANQFNTSNTGEELLVPPPHG